MHTIPMTLQQYINESAVTDALYDLLLENFDLKAQIKQLKQNMLDMTSVASAMNYVNKREYSFPLAQ